METNTTSTDSRDETTIASPRLVVAYAYSPRQGAGHHNSDHLMTLDAINFGRLSRRPYEALCRRNFWGLTQLADGKPADCPKCLSIAARLAAAEDSK